MIAGIVSINRNVVKKIRCMFLFNIKAIIVIIIIMLILLMLILRLL